MTDGFHERADQLARDIEARIQRGDEVLALEFEGRGVGQGDKLDEFLPANTHAT
jgi:hypothetical protein